MHCQQRPLDKPGPQHTVSAAATATRLPSALKAAAVIGASRYEPTERHRRPPGAPGAPPARAPAPAPAAAPRPRAGAAARAQTRKVPSSPVVTA